MDENRGLTMREILFRGKREDNGEWIAESETYIKDGDGTWLCDESNDVVKVLPETVGQYTGLTDKNGVKIFEGDILGGYLDDNYPENQTVMEVVWCNCWWGTKEIGCDPDLLEWEDGEILEIVGNVFDNPELLERGE